MRLSELLDGIEYKISENVADIEINKIEIDSRKIEANDVFFALTGLGSDGHNYIKLAVENGASVVVAEHEVESYDACLIITESTRMALALAAANYYNHPADKIKLIGVTGTNGKTTVTHIIKHLLEFKGDKVGLIGTNHYLIGDKELPSSGTTPEATELHSVFKKMADEGCKYVVMEVSSHALDLYRCYGLRFEVGVFTNLTEDHLNYHKNMDDYARAKSLLFSMSDYAVLNADDKYFKVMKKNAKNMITYGMGNSCEMTAENVEYSERGVSFVWKYRNSSVRMRMAIPGRFSVYNALAGLGACVVLGLSDDELSQGLMFVKGVKGRAEVLNTNTDYTIMIDYAHTPDGIENILNAVRGFTKKRIIIVFGCGGDRERAKRPKMGKIAVSKADFCVVTSDNPRTEEPSAIVDEILTGMKGKEKKYKAIVDRTEAIRYALSIAQKGDVVLLAGKGHETYQDIGGKKNHYDEREIIDVILKEAKN